MDHVLFISTAIPPYQESQTIRNVFLLRGLVNTGFRVTVITPEASGGDKDLEAMMPTCEIVRTPRPSYDRYAELLSRLPIGNYFKWLYGLYANLFRVPDNRAGWDRIVLQTVAAGISIQNCDVIISSSGSYTAHLAASWLARRYSKPFVAEMGDPWTYNPIWPATIPYRVWRNRRLELQSISGCSALIVTTDQTAKLYSNWLGNRLGIIRVIPMGYAASEFSDVNRRRSEPPFEVTYVGVAYRAARNLIPVLEGMNSLALQNLLRFKVVGPHSRSFVKEVGKRQFRFVQFRGHVPYGEALEEIKGADLLLIIGNPGGVQIPGKVFMYLASGRPILYLCQGEEDSDPAWGILRKFPGTICSQLGADDVNRALRTVFENMGYWEEESYCRLSMLAMREFEWEFLGKRFGDEVRALVDAAKGERDLL